MFESNRNLPVHLFTAEQVRELDRLAIEEHNIPGYTLMQCAARFSYSVLKQQWPDANNIAVVCGGGNNAGDGYVLAKMAIEDGKQVSVVNMFNAKDLKGDAATAYQDLSTTNICPQTYSTSIFDGVDVIVDALFGTGLDRDIEGKCCDVIKLMNTSESPTISIDIPSGINADTGNTMNVAVKADVTATFIGQKQGMFTSDGLAASGVIKI